MHCNQSQENCDSSYHSSTKGHPPKVIHQRSSTTEFFERIPSTKKSERQQNLNDNKKKHNGVGNISRAYSMIFERSKIDRCPKRAATVLGQFLIRKQAIGLQPSFHAGNRVRTEIEIDSGDVDKNGALSISC
jgi:hypothetical protein